MDSLTQIVLGAACGELALGRKIGNKAMLLGAIGGTIPDLDVLVGSLFMGELDSLAFHRGPSHSLLFGVLAPLPIAWFYQQFYQRSWDEHKFLRISQFVVGGLLALLLFGGIGVGLLFTKSVVFIPFGLLVLGVLGWRLNEWRKHYFSPKPIEIPNFRELYLLFFLAIFTHPILDAFTTYGTQLLLPFSNERVAWDTIAVADPLYTVPFGLALLLVLTLTRTNRWRTIITWIGLGWSLLYLGGTVLNKMNMDDRFATSLAEAEQEVVRTKTNPVILNNLLWYGVAEKKDSYVLGYHSLLDPQPKFVQLQEVLKNHEALAEYSDAEAMEVLPWFSDGYYSVLKLNDTLYQMNDLRFGALSGSITNPNEYVFKFFLSPQPDGALAMRTERPSREQPKALFSYLWNRILGRSVPEQSEVNVEQVRYPGLQE